jgi:hypothetical protein
MSEACHHHCPRIALMSIISFSFQIVGEFYDTYYAPVFAMDPLARNSLLARHRHVYKTS